jgi:hypothetical protein
MLRLLYGSVRAHTPHCFANNIPPAEYILSFAPANPYVLQVSLTSFRTWKESKTRSSIQIRIFAAQGPFILGAFVFCFNSTSNQRKRGVLSSSQPTNRSLRRNKEAYNKEMRALRLTSKKFIFNTYIIFGKNISATKCKCGTRV